MEEPGNDSEFINHGICPSCFQKFVAGTGEQFEHFLDSLPAPVLVVDQDARIVSANSESQQFFSKDLEEMQGRLGGEVFSCKYSNLPGGCGQTVHCKTCTIRITVTTTFESGKPCVDVPAYMDLGDRTGNKTIRFLISTIKIANAVIVQIADAQSHIHLCELAQFNILFVENGQKSLNRNYKEDPQR